MTSEKLKMSFQTQFHWSLSKFYNNNNCFILNVCHVFKFISLVFKYNFKIFVLPQEEFLNFKRRQPKDKFNQLREKTRFEMMFYLIYKSMRDLPKEI